MVDKLTLFLLASILSSLSLADTRPLHNSWRNASGYTVPSNGISTPTCSLAPAQNSTHTNTYQGGELIERLQHSLKESEAIIIDDLASIPASEQTMYRNNI